MRILVLDHLEEISRWAAAHIARRIRDAAPTEAPPFVLGLPTGSTPVATYRELAAMYKAGDVSFRHVVTFNMDEFVGLPPEHPASYHAFMERHLFSQIDIDPAHTHLPNGAAANPHDEARRYEEAIAASGGMDLLLGGVGTDGHLAFNPPGSGFGSRTRVISLSQDMLAGNARDFDNDPNKVPRQAITMGIATLLQAREIVILASGRAKAPAIREAVEDGLNHLCPLSSLQMHSNTIVVCDKDAASGLRPETLRYFRQLEEAGGWV